MSLKVTEIAARKLFFNKWLRCLRHLLYLLALFCLTMPFSHQIWQLLHFSVNYDVLRWTSWCIWPFAPACLGTCSRQSQTSKQCATAPAVPCWHVCMFRPSTIKPFHEHRSKHEYTGAPNRQNLIDKMESSCWHYIKWLKLSPLVICETWLWNRNSLA